MFTNARERLEKDMLQSGSATSSRQVSSDGGDSEEEEDDDDESRSKGKKYILIIIVYTKFIGNYEVSIHIQVRKNTKVYDLKLILDHSFL